MVRSVRFAAVGLLLVAPMARPAMAWYTVAEKGDAKLEVEARAMTWLVSGEQGSIADQTERVNDLLVRRFRVVVRGRSSKALSFNLQVGQDNLGGKALAEDNGIRVKDAYVNYHFDEGFQLVAGLFRVPFLRQNYESGFNQLLVDRAALPTFRPARDGLRDVGLMAWGNHGGFQYRLAAFDGSDQELKNTASSLRWTGRLAYNWFHREPDLAYTGTTIGARKVLQLAAQFDVQHDRLDSRDERDFATLPRDYRNFALEGFLDAPLGGAGAALTAEAAWLDRRDDYAAPDIATRELDGYYAQMGFLLPGKVWSGQLQLAARHEDYTTERGDADVSKQATVIGGTWYWDGHARKIQADYAFKRETPRVENDELRISLAATF